LHVSIYLSISTVTSCWTRKLPRGRRRTWTQLEAEERE
jgi:hypothetical protein